MHNKVRGWYIVVKIQGPKSNGQCNKCRLFEKHITEMPDSISGPVDDYLTETIEQPLILTKEMEVICKAEQKK